MLNSLISWFAFAEALWLLLALPFLVGLALFAWRARRRGWRQLGMTRPSSRRRIVRGLLVTCALLAVGIATAGPHWGKEQAAVVTSVRDLVVVLDVSRSMLAETPKRQERAKRVLTDLVTTLKQRGGHRVALVVFAAKAQLVMPLTTDYDLFQGAVLQQDAARLPAELRPGKDGAASGTRLGAGLQQAVAAHDPDPKYRGGQVILLVSDGDDPADDGEWKAGAAAARRAGIPVFVVGVGDPLKSSKIRVGETLLTFGGLPVETKLNEEILKEIAAQSDGSYFPARAENVAAGTLFPAILEAAAAKPREAPPVEDQHPRFRWFFAVGLILLVISLFIRDRRIVPRPQRWTEGEQKSEGGGRKPEIWGSWIRHGDTKRQPASGQRILTTVSLAILAVLLVAAAPQVEDFFRQGSDAYQRKDYEAALKFFEQAEDRAADPGLVAFNKGATLLRLARLREAELSYQRCLQDRECPAERRLKALYGLGTALLQRGADAKDLDAMRRAGESFEMCFKEAGADKALRDDAEHNWELSRSLWLKIRAELKIQDGMNTPDDPGKSGNAKPDQQLLGKDPAGKDRAGGTDSKRGPGEPSPAEGGQDVPSGGSAPTIADSQELQPLDPSDARDFLERAIRRIERDQAQAQGQGSVENPNVKDW